jgi:hypothetical protein
MRLSCALIVLVGLSVAGCAASENGSANAVDRCTDHRVGYLYTHLSAKVGSAFPRDETTAATKAICRRASSRGFLTPDGMISGPDFSTLVRTEADAFEPACRLSFLAGLKLFTRKHPGVGKYITEKVKKEYAAPCRLVGTTDFLRPGFLDFIELYRDHPEGLMPVCVAGQLATYDTSWAPAQKAALPRARFKKLATRSCREAVRTGVYAMSAESGVGQPEVRRQAFRRIFSRMAAPMVPQGEAVPNQRLAKDLRVEPVGIS